MRSAGRVGVIAVQGGVQPHLDVVRSLGAIGIPVRAAADLRDVTAIVLPGGESTAQRRLLETADMVAPLDAAVRSGVPLLATCAGAVLATGDLGVTPWIDVVVRRNGWGPQVASRIVRGDRTKRRLVLIRAPRIVRLGAGVQVLETVGGEPVAVRAGGVTLTTFHPELVGDAWLHEELLAMEVCA